jgi:NitT/TauT family transport system substrate-binding protein
MRTPKKSRLLMALAIFFAFALVAGACGDDSTDDASDDPVATDPPTDDLPEETDPFAGCGDDSVIDPSDLSVGRTIARCEPGYPMPIPLEERQTINFSSSFKLEFLAPILLADAMGEFEKENLEFNFIDLGFADAIAQVGTGDIDLAVGGSEAALYNTINNGFDVRWISGNFFPPSAGDRTVAQTGVWARSDVFSDPSNPDIAELAGTTMGSAVGLGSIIAYPIQQAFAPAGMVLGIDVAVQTMPSTDMKQALDNNAIQSAWMLDPLWSELAAAPDDFVLVATQPPGEPIGGLYGGPSCRETKRDACVAFHRAIIRVINTYLTGDYHQNADTVAAIALAIDQDAERIASTPAVNFDWEIREGTVTRAQEAFIGFAAAGTPIVEIDEPLPEDQVVDRSIYLEAIGKG